MNRFLRFILFLLLITTPALAIEEDISLPENTPFNEAGINLDGMIDDEDEEIITDDTEENFYDFKNLNKSVNKEESLFAKINKNLHDDTIKIDRSHYLFKDKLTFDYKKGPVERVQFYGKYRGNMSFNFQNGGDYSADYDVTTVAVGMMGEFRHLKDTDFKLQFNLTPVKDLTFFQQLLSDAYIVNRSIPHHQIFIGNSRNQVGVEGGLSTSLVPFVMRSQISRTFGNTRAFGARITGKYSLIDYSLAANSSDRFFKEFFPGAEFTGWVNFKPLGLTKGKYGKLVIGTGVSTGRNQNSYTVGGAYVGYTYKKFFINGEYSRANGYNGRYTSSNNAQGFYTTVGYSITPKIQVVGRFDWFDPNMDKSGDIRKEYSAGINYYLIGQGLKIMLNYVFCQNQPIGDSHRIILGTQILL